MDFFLALCFCFGPFFRLGEAQELGTVTWIVVAGGARIAVAVAKTQNCRCFGLLLCCLRVSKMSTVTGVRKGPGRQAQNCRRSWLLFMCSQRDDMQNCRRSWARLRSLCLQKNVNSHRDLGGCGSRNAEVSTVTRIRGVLKDSTCFRFCSACFWTFVL